MMNNGMGFGMGFGGFWMLLLVILAIVLIVWLIRAMGSQTSGTTRTRDAERESAVEVAERRYAEGEISQEEFESIKRDVT